MFEIAIMAHGSWLMAHGSWLMAHGSWLMARLCALISNSKSTLLTLQNFNLNLILKILYILNLKTLKRVRSGTAWRFYFK